MIRFARSSLASLTLSTASSFAQTTPRFARAGAKLRQIMKSGPFRNARTSMLARSATSRIEPGFHQYRRLASWRSAGSQECKRSRFDFTGGLLYFPEKAGKAKNKIEAAEEPRRKIENRLGSIRTSTPTGAG
jgi:hypothetical protein